MQLHGTYGAVVENVRDPEKLGRVKARVPHVHGVDAAGAGYIGSNDLPWAMPAGMPAGGSAQSGGFSHLPAPGDHVWVRFLDGEPEKPLWEWGMQTFGDRDRLKLHQYAATTTGETGVPKSAYWTRFNHAFELTETGVNAVTSGGYSFQLVNGINTGRIELATALGNFLRLDDLDDGATFFFNLDWSINVGESVSGRSNGFSWKTASQDFTVASGNALSLEAAANMTLGAVGTLTLDALGAVDLSAPLIRVGGASAVQPMVLGTLLISYLEALNLYLSTHTHGNGNNGSPTSPPILPPQASTPPTALLVSKTAFTV